MKRSMTVFLALTLLLLVGAAAAAPETPGKSKRFGVILNGGMSFIDGGDLNVMIKQMNIAAANIPDPTETATIDWGEFKGIPRLGAEILYYASDRLALSLGFEILKKKNVGDIALTRAWTQDYDYGDITQHEEFESLGTIRPENTLSAVPLTLSVTYFIPVGKLGRAFVKAGIGYYMARLKSSYAFDSHDTHTVDQYYLGTLSDVYIEESTLTSNITDESKVNAVGFHGGLGLEIDLSRTLALVLEGGVRVADLENWSGTGKQASEYWFRYGWQSTGITEASGSDSDSYAGDLVLVPNAGIPNASLVLVENLGWEFDDVRPAVIKLGGATLKLGFKIRF